MEHLECSRFYHRTPRAGAQQVSIYFQLSYFSEKSTSPPPYSVSTTRGTGVGRVQRGGAAGQGVGTGDFSAFASHAASTDQLASFK